MLGRLLLGLTLVMLAGCTGGDSEARRAAALDAARQYLVAARVAMPSWVSAWMGRPETSTGSGSAPSSGRIRQADQRRV